jgi:membrane associated rhomboid family serine protease/lipoprotein NlpI
MGWWIAPRQQIAIWIHGGGTTDPMVFLSAIVCLLFFGLGFRVLYYALRGIPRLSIDTTGIVYETAFGTMRAHWNSLAPFKEITKGGGDKKKVYAAASVIVGKEVSKNLAKTTHFKLTDCFTDNLENIVAALNHYRVVALTGAAPDVLNPQVSDSGPIEKLSQIGDPTIGKPWVTLAIILVLVLVFGIEVFRSVSNGSNGVLNRGVLMAVGALNRNAIVDTHEWYRIFTAPWLHASFMHLFLNSIALFFAGLVLEKLYGRIWFFAFFIIGGIGGSLMSLAVNPAEVFSVGASGAIMALFSALFVTSYRLPSGSLRNRVQIQTLRILIPALFPTASAAGPKIDVGAHFGGFLAGLIVAAVLLKIWPRHSVSPPGKKFAKGVSIAGLIAIVISFGCVVSNQQYICAGGGDTEKTIKACTAIIQANKEGYKEIAASLIYRGLAYTQQKQNDLALLDLNRAVELDPNPAALAARAAIFTTLRRYNEGIQDYGRAISLTKDSRLLPGILALRASAYIGNGQIREAAKDIDRALSIDPTNATALNVGAGIYIDQGEYDQAIDGLNRALQHAPADSDLYWVRGEAKMFKGPPESAIDDLRRAVVFESINAYKVLWLHIAHAKAGQDDRQELQRNNSELVADKWPQPVVDLYLNKSTVDDVIAKAKTGDMGTQRDQLCEAHFYISELYLQQGAKTSAKQFMQEAADNCPIDFMEHAAARIELKNLGN